MYPKLTISRGEPTPRKGGGERFPLPQAEGKKNNLASLDSLNHPAQGLVGFKIIDKNENGHIKTLSTAHFTNKRNE